MQTYTPLQVTDDLDVSFPILAGNLESIQGQNSGTVVPSSELILGQPFFHTGEKESYTLVSVSPITWRKDVNHREAVDLKTATDLQASKWVSKDSAGASTSVANAWGPGKYMVSVSGAHYSIIEVPDLVSSSITPPAGMQLGGTVLNLVAGIHSVKYDVDTATFHGLLGTTAATINEVWKAE